MRVIGSSSDDSSDICGEFVTDNDRFFHPHWTFRSVKDGGIFLRHWQINRYRCKRKDSPSLSLSLFPLVSVRYFWMANRIRNHLLDSSDFLVTYTRRRKENIRGFDDTSIDMCVIVSLSRSIHLIILCRFICLNPRTAYEKCRYVREVIINFWMFFFGSKDLFLAAAD